MQLEDETFSVMTPCLSLLHTDYLALHTPRPFTSRGYQLLRLREIGGEDWVAQLNGVP